MTAKFCSEFDLAAFAGAWPAPSPLQKIPARLMRRLDRLIEVDDAVATEKIARPVAKHGGISS